MMRRSRALSSSMAAPSFSRTPLISSARAKASSGDSATSRSRPTAGPRSSVSASSEKSRWVRMGQSFLARASGMSTSRIYTATFALSAALAGLAGALIVPIYSLSGDLGLRFLIQSFLAVLLGGADLIAGAMAGAGVVGALNTTMPWVVSPAFAEILLVVIALTIIRTKPAGLVNRGVN